jgi:hypothetical protein
MRTIFVFFSIALITPSAALALDTVSCVDNDREITFNYDLDHAATPPVTRVEMQLTDDFGFSTDPAHPKHDGEYISDGFSSGDIEGGDVSWDEEDGSRHLTMSFRIGRASHGAFHAIGGVVSIGGGGVWVVECQSSDYGVSGS